MQRALRGAVDRRARKPDQTQARRDVDDRAAAPFGHHARAGELHGEGAEDVDVEDLARPLEGRVEQRHAGEVERGVVDEDVERAEALERGLHRPVGRGRIGHVPADERRDVRAELSGQLHARLLAAGDEDEAGALARERPRDRATDPFGRACDDRDLAAEATAHETTDSGQTAASPYFGAL